MGFDPATIGAVLSGVSAIAGDMAQKKQLQYQAQVAQNNARVADMNAKYAAIVGQQKEQAEAYKVRGLLGRQVATQAANGLDVNSGSAADVRASTQALGMQSFANIRDAGARDYYGYLGQKTNFQNQADIYKASEPDGFTMGLHALTAAAGTYAGVSNKAATPSTATPSTAKGSASSAGALDSLLTSADPAKWNAGYFGIKPPQWTVQQWDRLRNLNFSFSN